MIGLLKPSGKLMPFGMSSLNESNRDNRVCLRKYIAAIQAMQEEQAGSRLGILSQLAPGTTVEPVGCGFNDRTVKVRATNGLYYFIFLQDLEAQSPGRN
jgi:hypothetical protein